MYSFLSHMLEHFELRPEQEKLVVELEYLFKVGLETTKFKVDSTTLQTPLCEIRLEQNFVSKELKSRQKDVVENLYLYEYCDNSKKLNVVSNNRLKIAMMEYQKKYVSGKLPLSFLSMCSKYEDGGFKIEGFLSDDKNMGGYTISVEKISLSDKELGKLIRSILSNGMNSIVKNEILTVCNNLLTIDNQYLLEICYYDAEDLLNFVRINGYSICEKMDGIVSAIKESGFKPKYNNSVIIEISQTVNLAAKIIEEGTDSLLEFFDFSEFTYVDKVVRKREQKR